MNLMDYIALDEERSKMNRVYKLSPVLFLQLTLRHGKSNLVDLTFLIIMLKSIIKKYC